jgi:hypothetical protein
MNADNAPSKDVPVDKPTWLKEIRYMFTETDIKHMANLKPRAIHLDDYDDVKQRYHQIKPQIDYNRMPPGSPWSAAWKQTFTNWQTNNFAKGTEPAAHQMLLKATGNPSVRVRKDIEALSDPEVAKLIEAFEGIVARDPHGVNSYYKVAESHGVPNYYCAHMVPPFMSWHRAYMLDFENALRSVPGCEDVTLPYWDFNKPFPKLLQNPPFDKYTFPATTGTYPKGSTSERNPVDQINSAFKQYVLPGMKLAMKKTNWQEFQGYFINKPNTTLQQSHNNGHNYTGKTLQNPDYASYDPMFWFFHCNWDRLWWEWQTDVVHARNWDQLKTVTTKMYQGSITPSYSFFEGNQPLAPFNQKPQDLLDVVNQLGYDYAPPSSPSSETNKMALHAPVHGSIPAAESFMINTQHVNVRVKGVNRLGIPGSFTVHLLKDGERIGSQSHFQFVNPNRCKTCADNPIVFFDFDLPIEKVQNGRLSVEIEPADKDFVGDRIPMSMAGNPTINVRMLMHQEEVLILIPTFWLKINVSFLVKM